MSESSAPPDTESIATAAPPWRTIIGCTIVIIAIIGLYAYLKNAKPEAKKVDPPDRTPSVEVAKVLPADSSNMLESQGVVESLRTVSLAAEVSGKIAEISPHWKKGGHINEGDLIARIDDADYIAARARSEAMHAQALETLATEEAQAALSISEWRRVSKDEPSALTKREPQLNRARTLAESTRADLEKAKRDEQRTHITAPFSGRVRNANVEMGSIITPGNMLGELYSDRELELRVPIRLKESSEIDITKPATLRSTITDKDKTWTAKIIGLDGEIDRSTHTAQAILRINIAEKETPPPVGMFLRATLPLITRENLHIIPREAVIDGDHVHIVNDLNEIELLPIQLIRGDEQHATVKGLNTNHRVCVTKLQVAMPRMKVRIIETP